MDTKKCKYGPTCVFVNAKCKWCRKDDVEAKVLFRVDTQTAPGSRVLPKCSHAGRAVVPKGTCDPTLVLAVLLDCNVLRKIMTSVLPIGWRGQTPDDDPTPDAAFDALCTMICLLSSCTAFSAHQRDLRLVASFRKHVSSPIGLTTAQCMVYYGSSAAANAPPIVAAAARGEMRDVREQLAAGADPNRADEGGRSALSWACTNGHVAIAELLTTVGANVNHISGDFGESGPELTRFNQWTPLHLAAGGSGGTAVVRLLLTARANVNGARYNETPTPLNVASRKREDMGRPWNTHLARGSDVVALLTERGGHL